MKYFFDNNIPQKLVSLLKVLNVEVRHLKDVFPETAADVQWIPRAGAENWVVVTSDRNIRTNPAELEALKENNVTVLFMKKPFVDRKMWDQAARTIKHWPKINGQAERLKRGTLTQVSDNGNLEII